jgi:hypothetical protein
MYFSLEQGRINGDHFLFQVPEWLHVAAYSAGGINEDRAFLLSELTGIFSVF